jgi:hypothetical protein
MTPTERLIKAGAADDADEVGLGWGDPAVALKDGEYAFARTGASNSKLHISDVKGAYAYSDVTVALCGVGVETGSAQTFNTLYNVWALQTFNTLYDREHCPKCLRVIEKKVVDSGAPGR